MRTWSRRLLMHRACKAGSPPASTSCSKARSDLHGGTERERNGEERVSKTNEIEVICYEHGTSHVKNRMVT